MRMQQRNHGARWAAKAMVLPFWPGYRQIVDYWWLLVLRTSRVREFRLDLDIFKVVIILVRKNALFNQQTMYLEPELNRIL